jgi:hypothetical protein
MGKITGVYTCKWWFELWNTKRVKFCYIKSKNSKCNAQSSIGSADTVKFYVYVPVMWTACYKHQDGTGSVASLVQYWSVGLVGSDVYNVSRISWHTGLLTYALLRNKLLVLQICMDIQLFDCAQVLSGWYVSIRSWCYRWGPIAACRLQ